MKLYIILFFFTFNVFAYNTIEIKKEMRSYIAQQGLLPIKSQPFEITKKYILGQALFFDKLLSGNRDIACSSCHLHALGTSDDSPHSVGPGGLGLGRDRKNGSAKEKHLRNSLALWNRDDKSVKALFWDGRIEVLDPVKHKYRSPLGDLLPGNIDNVLAVQALFPLVAPGEMLGYNVKNSDNDLINSSPNLSEHEKIKSIHNRILNRLIGKYNSKPTSTHRIYRRLFNNAYPEVPINDINIAHVGNALAHYQEIAFATRDAKWDRYLSGDDYALSNEALIGARLFYIKFQCNTCHSGAIFSDYNYHSVAISSKIEKNGKLVEDFGRYYVTFDVSDRYKFRTPPLRNVTLTAPYMHDGSISSLNSAIKRHFLDCSDEEKVVCNKMNYSNILATTKPPNNVEIAYLMSFLSSLEDNTWIYRDYIIPKSVPSGYDIDAVNTEH